MPMYVRHSVGPAVVVCDCWAAATVPMVGGEEAECLRCGQATESDGALESCQARQHAGSWSCDCQWYVSARCLDSAAPLLVAGPGAAAVS